MQYEASNRHSSILKRYVGEEATDLVIVNRKTALPTSLYCPEFKTSILTAEEKKKTVQESIINSRLRVKSVVQRIHHKLVQDVMLFFTP